MSAVFSATSKLKFSSSWPGRVLVIALDHVQAHRVRVLDHLVDDRLELAELVDVVAVGLRHALEGGRAVLVGLEPDHLGLEAGAQVHARALRELGLDQLEVVAAVGREVGAAVLDVLAAAEAGAPDARDLGVPRQHLERLGLGQADELGGLGAVADVLAVPVDEEVGGRAVDELEALARHRLPVRGGHALAHDPARDRDELVVDVRHARSVDLLAHVLDQLIAPRGTHELFEVGRHQRPPDLARPAHHARIATVLARCGRSAHPARGWDDTPTAPGRMVCNLHVLRAADAR